MWQEFMNQFPQLWTGVGRERFWRVKFRILPDKSILITPLPGVQIDKGILVMAERKAAEIVQQSDTKNAK